MLATAKTYLHPNMVPAQREDMLVDIECVVIFLAMHIIETTAAKPTAPTIAYEAVWPLDEKGEVYPSSPVASPSSPAKEVRSRALSPMSSPMSPRSPRNSPQKPQSPRTLTTSATRTPRASTQHLHSVRQKIPIILRALNSSDIENIGGIDLDEGKLDFQVSRRVADALGMVLCGGQSRDQTVSPLSSLHPAWSGENESSLQSILAQDFVAWINLHLSMNDLLYPALQTPSMLEGVDEGMKATHHPQRVSTPLGSLSRFSPTVISTVTATTIIHVVTSGYSRTSSFRSRHADRSSHRPSDASYHDLFDSDAEFNLDIGVSADTFLSTDGDHSNPSASPVRQDLNAGSVSYDDTNESKYDLAADQRFRELLPADHQAPNSKIENALPQLFLSYCSRSKLYMVSPYYSATVTGSADCDIVIGAVYGAVIVNGCERVRITAACRRLVVLNCLECEFQVASLSPTVIIGDCRNLSFGPHNVNYRNLKHHLRLVDLASLMGPSASSTASISSIPNLEATSNQWSSLCDVNTCLDLAGTNASALASGERLASTSTVGQAVYELPSPHAATATLQPVDKFKALVVPVKSEFAQLEVMIRAAWRLCGVGD